MVLVWTGVSYIPVNSVPQGIPRRLFSPNPWSPGAYSNWTVIKVLSLFSPGALELPKPRATKHVLDYIFIVLFLLLPWTSYLRIMMYFNSKCWMFLLYTLLELLFQLRWLQCFTTSITVLRLNLLNKRSSI